MIPFNKPYLTGRELDYIAQAHSNGQLAGDGEFTKRCNTWLQESFSCLTALLTHSCTAALEMSALLADISPGDEVILPSYTFVSTANAFLLRGAVPVFVDISIDTLCIDESRIEEKITPRTRAIVVVHYAGLCCDMSSVYALARKYDLLLIEDAAQAVGSFYKGAPLGGIGDMGCLSFHETKNIISGEGGALLVRDDSKLSRRAEIIREKGTNRREFFKGLVDKYTWVDIGSSYLPGEITAAFLWAQLESSSSINLRRMSAWNAYHTLFEELECRGNLKRPSVPLYCQHNAHMYHLIVDSQAIRDDLIEFAKSRGVQCVFHYVPLHQSSIGRSYCSPAQAADLANTEYVSECLLRLPLWVGIEDHVEEVHSVISAYFSC